MRRQGAIIAAVPLLIAVGMAIVSRHFELFRWISEENHLLEWLQFLLLVAASVLLARSARNHVRAGFWVIGGLFLLAAVGVFFVAGEEIAWGQQVFGWGTPEPLAEVNVQGETTLHNIGAAHNLFINLVMIGSGYAMIAPLMFSPFLGVHRRDIWYLLVPPLCLVPAFAMPFGYRFTRLLLTPEEHFPHAAYIITKYSETTELCLYVGVFVFAVLLARRRGRA